MGLSVVLAVATVLLLAAVPILKPVILAPLAGLLIVGLIYIIVVAARGRLEMDAFSRKAMGLWRWAAWRGMRESIGTPVRVFRKMMSVPKNRALRMMLLPLLIVAGSLSSWIAISDG